eukprot:TRINITY_DN8463_c0_g1_i2.p2 TRINITY_DN8463_c0_g1~~TRINITY_DN8463_c0_g1_i2.p2  ORF type:complete len:101 (-),score=6.45 TRINITY_DN8463_c0_g1_i2:31-333(-)
MSLFSSSLSSVPSFFLLLFLLVLFSLFCCPSLLLFVLFSFLFFPRLLFLPPLLLILVCPLLILRDCFKWKIKIMRDFIFLVVLLSSLLRSVVALSSFLLK